MKHLKRTLAVLLTLVLLCTGASVAFAEPPAVIDNGTCGEDLTWTLDSDGTLTISGEGNISEESFAYRTDILSVRLENGVSSIGNKAFYK